MRWSEIRFPGRILVAAAAYCKHMRAAFDGRDRGHRLCNQREDIRSSRGSACQYSKGINGSLW